MLTSNFTIYPL